MAHRWSRWLVPISLLAGAVAAVFVVLRPRPLQVELVKVRKGMMSVTINEVARARVKDQYTVSAPLAGNVLRLELRPGDHVDAGAVLARIVPAAPPLMDARSKAEAQARVAAAEAAHKQAQAAIARAELIQQRASHELEESKRLEKNGIVSEDARERAELEAKVRAEDSASARFAAKMAAHEAAMARVALQRLSGEAHEEHLEVVAPASGVVLRVLAPSSGVRAAGTPLLELGDPAALEVVCEVLTADAVRIHPGNKVVLERWGGGPLQGRVRLVEPSAFTRISSLGVDEQRVAVIIDLTTPREQWSTLGDGYRLDAQITVWEHDGEKVASEGAFFRRGADWFAFVVVQGKAELRRLKLGQRNGQDAQIEEGVEEGDALVLFPGERVLPGLAVQGTPLAPQAGR